VKKMNSLDFAWQAHQAQEDWTGKADIKGSILLAADGTVLAALLAFAREESCTLRVVWFLCFLCLTASAVFAGLTIKPRIGAGARVEGIDFVYFGHLKDMEPSQLAVELEHMTAGDAIHGLSKQLVVMSRTNWRKHKLLIASTWCAVIGFILILAIAFVRYLA